MEQDQPANHPFVFTLTGLCLRCRKGIMDHVTPEPEGYKLRSDGPDPLTECLVDHNSVVNKRVKGELGERWTFCPECSVMIEPKLATGVPEGRPSGPGRGSLTDRLKHRLSSLPGWADFNGGR
jgi:hypothetical protein